MDFSNIRFKFSFVFFKLLIMVRDIGGSGNPDLKGVITFFQGFIYIIILNFSTIWSGTRSGQPYGLVRITF